MPDDDGELPYLQSGNTDRKWAERALESAVAGRLHVNAKALKDSRLMIRATGECPRCSHDVNYEFIETVVGPKAGGRAVPGGSYIESRQPDLGSFVDANVLCWCEQKHPGRPAGSLGCGVGFSIGVKES